MRRPSWDRTKGRPEPIAALDRVRELENGEPLVDLRLEAPSVRIPKPQTIPYVRATVARMAERAANALPSGVHLAVTDAWRPFARQVLIYEWLMGCAQEAFPSYGYAQLRRVVCRFVAPVNRKTPPGHTTGAAIDVWLEDDEGVELDVCSPYDRFHASPTYTMGLSPRAQHNRNVLVEAMLEVGFSNCRDEWWHYSFGDAGWAVRMGRTECFYGRVELPPQEYEEQQTLWIEAHKLRENPFIAGLKG